MLTFFFKIMIKHILLVLILGINIFTPGVYASVSDSLKQRLSYTSGKDKISLLYQLYLENNGNDSAFYFINKLQEEGARQKNLTEEMRAMGLRMQAFANANYPDSLAKYAPSVIAFLREHKNYDFMFSVQDLVISHLILRKQFTQALKSVNEQYEEAKRLNSATGLAIANKNLGLIYRYTGRPEEATRFYTESIEYLKEAGNGSLLLINLYLELILVHREIGNFKQALENCNKCFNALNHLKKETVFDKLQENTFKAQYFTCLCYKASTCIDLNRLDEAEKCIREALKAANPSWKGIWLYPLWEAQMKFYIASANYQEAQKYQKLMFEFSDERQFNTRLYLENMQARIFVGMEKYKEACRLYENVLAAKDSLASIHFARQLDEVRSLYEVDKLEMKAEKNQLHMILSLLCVLTLAIICILLGIIIFIIRRNSRNLEEKNRKLFLQLKEKDALEAKIEQLSTIQTETPPTNDKGQTDDTLFVRLQKWLEKDHKYTNNKITPEEVAAELSTNSRYLYEAIRNATGQTFNDYINTLRLEYARKLLSEKGNELTIEGISSESGFNTRSNFYRLFRLKYGLTPSELKKQDEECNKDYTPV